MSELLVNDASTIAASTATTLAGRSTDGLETLLDQLSATLQRSEVDGVSLPTQSQTRALEPLFVFGLAGARYGVSMSQVVASCRKLSKCSGCRVGRSCPTWRPGPSVRRICEVTLFRSSTCGGSRICRTPVWWLSDFRSYWCSDHTIRICRSVCRWTECLV